MSHPNHAMTFVGRDYITERINGKRCHHKAIYVCPECNTEKRYFLNLMPKNRIPFCSGARQRLEIPL